MTDELANQRHKLHLHLGACDNTIRHTFELGDFNTVKDFINFEMLTVKMLITRKKNEKLSEHIKIEEQDINCIFIIFDI